MRFFALDGLRRPRPRFLIPRRECRYQRRSVTSGCVPVANACCFNRARRLLPMAAHVRLVSIIVFFLIFGFTWRFSHFGLNGSLACIRGTYSSFIGYRLLKRPRPDNLSLIRLASCFFTNGRTMWLGM